MYKDSFNTAKKNYEEIAVKKQVLVTEFSQARQNENDAAVTTSADQMFVLQKQSDSIRKKVSGWVKKAGGDGNDTNYIFLNFVVAYLPPGLVGLLIAIIFLASWGSIAAALNSLASCTMVDFHRRFSKKRNYPGS